MKKLIIIFFMLTLAAHAQRTPFNLQSIMAKDVPHKTTSIKQYQKWKKDPAIQTAYINDSIEQLTDLFVRTSPDTLVVLEHNTMGEWFVRVQFIRDDPNHADEFTYTVDGTGKVINKIRPYTGVVKDDDDGMMKTYRVVDEIDPLVNVVHVTQVLRTGEEGKSLQREVDALLSKF